MYSLYVAYGGSLMYSMYVAYGGSLMYSMYRIAGNFRREIFSEISKMLYTFRKFISEKLLRFCWQRATIVIQSKY